MKELSEYRTQLVGRLASMANNFRKACLAVKDPHAPLEKNGWNTHQVAAHTRDVNLMAYGLRAKRTAQEDNPEFQNFDGDAYMLEKYDASESLNELLDGFIDNINSLTNMLSDLQPEAWSRESRHITLGSGFTLQTWVERALAHIEEHLKTINRDA